MPGKTRTGVAGILDGVPHGLKEDPFLRIDELCLAFTIQVLMAKTTEIINGLEMASVKALNVISPSAKRRLEA